MTKEELDSVLERIGSLIDTVDNFRQYGFENPFTPKQRLDAMAYGLNSIRDELFDIYTDMGGEDVWEESDD